ncbi:hypothetical protein NE237_007205 [Protea cynaroides]|uniref:Protein phosphatase n=1 Tax=Protea cynaroides TaxID=273540 RepID=A0A9Q0KPS6_9MAGN|nr:hypothetical protein NE237_007205 [Protea cynaroides]
MSIILDKQEFKVPVEEGDVVVAGTDGLFDNLFAEDIVDMVFPTTYIGKFPYWLAELIAKDAKMTSHDKLYASPFSLGAEMFGFSHCGGKPDNITVLVAYINGLTPKGDDSHFICEEDDVFGVADGVGSWAKKGIDAGKYARELMTNCVMTVQNEPKGFIHPLSVLEKAYSNTKSEGSSTACIVALTNDNCLHFANVGDSGFVVIRGDSVIYGSPIQQRKFNCPFQLGNHAHNDEPSSAFEFKVPVEEGDVVVAGTDGLFDNLFAEDIVDMVFPTTYIGKFPYWLAELIAKDAKMTSQDKLYASPFSLGAEMSGFSHCGGKPDDITVLVAYIVSSRES